MEPHDLPPAAGLHRPIPPDELEIIAVRELRKLGLEIGRVRVAGREAVRDDPAITDAGPASGAQEPEKPGSAPEDAVERSEVARAEPQSPPGKRDGPIGYLLRMSAELGGWAGAGAGAGAGAEAGARAGAERLRCRIECRHQPREVDVATMERWLAASRRYAAEREEPAAAILLSASGYDAVAVRLAAERSIPLLRVGDGRAAYGRSEWGMGAAAPAWIPEFMAELVERGPAGEVRARLLAPDLAPRVLELLRRAAGRGSLGQSGHGE